MSKPTPTHEPTPPPAKSPDAATALAALYQGEKTDASYIFNTAMAMMGLAVAYLVGAISFVEKFANVQDGWFFIQLLPAPLWLVVAFHSLITLNAMSHGVSVKIIEDALFKMSGLPAETGPWVGSAAADRIMDVNLSKPVHKVTTYVVYGGVGLLVIFFTIYAIRAAALIISPSDFWRVMLLYGSSATYSLLLAMSGWSWFEGFRTLAAGHAIASSYGRRGASIRKG